MGSKLSEFNDLRIKSRITAKLFGNFFPFSSYQLCYPLFFFLVFPFQPSSHPFSCPRYEREYRTRTRLTHLPRKRCFDDTITMPLKNSMWIFFSSLFFFLLFCLFAFCLFFFWSVTFDQSYFRRNSSIAIIGIMLYLFLKKNIYNSDNSSSIVGNTCI